MRLNSKFLLLFLLLASPAALAQTIIPSQSSSTPSGAAGGGLAGTYPNPTVSAVPASAMPALTGDCTTSAGAVATTCTKTNGSLFGNAATATIGGGANNVVALDGGGKIPAYDGTQITGVLKTANNLSDVTAATARTNLGLGGYSTISAGVLTNSIAGNVTLNSATYADGPSVAQGSTGTWFASGTVTATDTVAVDSIACKLWDGTTAVTSGVLRVSLANAAASLSLAGFVTSPAGNLRISCLAGTNTALLLSNTTGVNRDSNITAFRIN